ncbi:SH3 domain-containing protein [Delftia tsuruhatensis]|uniref:SH3 domain-containing protein n=1 Tax=Delftia tsuruhatensis TaxID=180282 RepID=UPI001E7F766A|nr:SH3 domain-containing protein [Delftia tsuruhatensis]CAB5716408.1 SH3 domain-containing protein [Delftia tsuruhatensis]CAC9686010.1 SH3 domain-containing protein [Delftia tsuruhatensis]
MPRNQRLAARWLTAATATFAILTSILAPAAAQAREFVSIKGASVNVRAQPTTRSATLWELGKGYPLQVVQRKGQWLRVKDNETTLGWVHAPLTGKTPHMVVTARTANLRAGPGQNHRVVGKLDELEVVRTLRKQGTWAQVQRDNGQKGWVARSLAWGW